VEDKNLRYSGLAKVPYSFMNEFLVECPKCRSLAVVTTDQKFDTSNDKLVCGNCNHIEKAHDRNRYEAIVKRACDNCGKAIEVIIPNNKEKVEELTIPCSHCGIVRTYKPKNDQYRLKYQSNGVCDPIFSLPLWFQTDVKGEVFWAYNRTHLNEIRDYVSAKLRERQTTTHMTMVERLPNFIKAAKNREVIVRAIDKMLER
jgi:DNA-directed RNA polymerase subunit M/transcription elongation factor TFIIS